ncbi:septal ring lytic transglycosylase RlpA family protein [Pontibacter chitinilyticus]|uniref:septal ring lytic transglycosylase RlpA family protein n=1 Tax=Pontibacter chitinilyticus TaxID=2674989 RepID=UPI0032199111
MVRALFTALLVAPLITVSAHGMGLTAVRDSVGVERKNGKLFVQHKVEPKETLYALSRKYNVAVSQIEEANPSMDAGIKIGQIVLIPRKYTAPAAKPKATTATASPATAPTASNRTYTVSEAGNKTHTVQTGQTLYAISRLYDVSVDDLKRWNNLPDNSISVGSELIVSKGGATPTKKPVYVPEADDEIKVTKPAPEPVVVTASTATAPVPATTAPAAAKPEPVTAKTESDDEDAAGEGVKKVVESGMAEMIDPKADTNKYLALHKSAPVGTIMQVKNAMNGQVVYVRVIGKLPDTGDNDKVLVRISKKAYQKLGAVDQKFRVEVSYMP